MPEHVVGVPREIKTAERRVGMTPEGVRGLVDAGVAVVVEAAAGEGSAIPDDDYRAAGATVVETAAEVWGSASLVVKVKEPQPDEIEFLRPGLVLFTYLHLAAYPDVAEALLQRGVTGVAYETVELPSGALPLLEPMSEVAGRMAPQVGAHFLERPQGGRGILLGGVPGVQRARVVVLGAGTVGSDAARIAVGMGGNVVVLNRGNDRLRTLSHELGASVTTLAANAPAIEREVSEADLVIGAVLVAGDRAPILVTRDVVASMRPGSVIVDVAVDQGGCVETTRETTHDDPAYEVDGVVHYAVGNMPGAVPRTSTYALTNATFPYVRTLATQGLAAVETDTPLALGINTFRGAVTNPAVAHALGREPAPLVDLR